MGAQWKTASKVGERERQGQGVHQAREGDHDRGAQAAPIPPMNARAARRGRGGEEAVDAARHARARDQEGRRPARRDRRPTRRVTYEGFAPHRVPVIVECLTDNKNRTATNVRVLFRKGQLGARGSVSWDFAHLGLVEATPPEAGARSRGGRDRGRRAGRRARRRGRLRASTPSRPISTRSARRCRPRAGPSRRCASAGARRIRSSSTTRPRAPRSRPFLAAIDDDDDVQHIYVGLA